MFLVSGDRPIEDVYEEIRSVYREHDHPWVIGYSGGKDSTTALQLVWMAIAGLPEEERTKPIFVISTDTLVETPVIVDHVRNTIDRINAQAEKDKMPVTAQILRPDMEDTFWVQLIGKGYPAPSSIFRWCTDRLKIKPSNKFIKEQVARYGDVILVLGSRRGESMTRDQIFNKYQIPGSRMDMHGQLNNAWVYMPIEHFSTDDVWTYLLQHTSPWGNDNRQLASLYQSAQDGECPLVVDTTTPSCGNSRFGCWTCTVVSRDRSMEAMIDSGEEWMQPLLDFRDYLAETQDPEVKQEQREYKGRNGRIRFSKSGRLLYRTYKLDFSKQMLRRLLETQKEIYEHDPDFSLISEAELHEIRHIWLTERQDWEDSIPKIYKEVTGRELAWKQYDIALPGHLEHELLRRVAGKHNAPENMMQKLIDAEWQNHGLQRRATIHTEIARIMGEDWRTLEEAKAEAQQRQQPVAETQDAAAEEA